MLADIDGERIERLIAKRLARLRREVVASGAGDADDLERRTALVVADAFASASLVQRAHYLISVRNLHPQLVHNLLTHRCGRCGHGVVAVREPPTPAPRDDAAKGLAVAICPIGQVEPDSEVGAVAE